MNNLVLAQIKETLHNFNLPVIPIWTSASTPREGRIYIKGNKIVRYINNQYTVINDYYRGAKKLNLTKNLIMNSTEYDQYTHEYLGDYLRFVRDYDKINLMGMYNCFNFNTPNKLIRTFSLSATADFNIDTLDQRFDIFIVPVKLDTEYTIKVDSHTPLEAACVIYSDSLLQATPDELVTKSYVKLRRGTQLYSTKLNFTDPATVKSIVAKEKYLRLVIKLPTGTCSNITMLEGNWIVTSNNSINGVLSADIEYGAASAVDYDYIIDTKVYKNSLLYESAFKPFSDRLIEYLLDNAIIPDYGVNGAIEKVKNIVYKDAPISGLGNEWDNNLTYELNKIASQPDKTKGLNKKYMNNSILSSSLTASALYSSAPIYTSEGTISSEGYVGLYITPKPEGSIKREVRMCDIYTDITGCIDKDMEAALRITANVEVN